ncbi:F-box/WD repeat-containing protein [Sporobolomyces salmoneus]|uniref:F-box/WD repeat-containing protein n=1 Tax=Sporobolomyces salmoneus TaxID=183962 RepID=UPI00317D22D2
MNVPPSPSLGQLRTIAQEPRTTTTRTRQVTTSTNRNQTLAASSRSLDFPASSPFRHETSSMNPNSLPSDTENRTQEAEEEEEEELEDRFDELSGEDYAELRILPSTTTSVVTTTTTLTTHFAPIRIPKSSAATSSSRSLFGLKELVDRESTFSTKEGRKELDLKTHPLSQTEWTTCGLGNFKVELGELTARFEHDPKGKGKAVNRRTSLSSGRAGERRDVKGKGKERQSDRVEPGGNAGKRVEDPRRITSPSAATSERRSSIATRSSPGPPPRKRPRSEVNEAEEGDENVKMKTVSLPSPNHSPTSPISAYGEEDDSRDTLIPNLDDARAEQLPRDRRPEKPSTQLPSPQSFNLGQSPAISSLLALPDLVDTFDQLSPSLQSYLIFNLLRRSSIPVLQTVANIISPALRRDFLSDLPPELSVQILGYLDPTTLCRASLVCKSWRRLVDGEWRIWKKIMDLDGLWIGDGSEEKEAREIVTGKKENWFLKRWKAGVWDQTKKSSWDGKVDSDRKFVENVHQRRPSESTSSVRPASPSSSREASLTPPPPPANDDLRPHSVHPYKILYRRRWLTRRNWKEAEPRRTTFTSSTAATNVVTCLQFDEEKIVSASDDADHSIHVFDTQSGSERAELLGHEGGVWALQYVGNVLVSGSTDKSVRVWDLDSAKCTHEFLGHTSTVRCLQIVEPINVNPDPNGEPVWEPPYPLVVTGSRDWSLRVWKLPFAGRDREYHPAVPMSPTEGGASEPSDNPYYERQLSGHRHAVRAVAAAGRTVVSGSYDHNVRVWDLLTGECQHVLEGHSLKVYSVVLDHHRKQCASGSMDGTVKIWSTETGEQLHSLDGHSSLVGLLGLSRRCLVSAAADWTLRIWDPETGQCRHALNAHQGAITCFQHDEYKIVSGSDGTLKMWDTQTGDFVRDLLANLTGVWQVAFNSRYCIAAVQRNGASEFELLDFGSVSQDEIKVDTSTNSRRALSTPSPPTPTRNFDRDPSPTVHDHADIDMLDSSQDPSTSTSTSRKPLDPSARDSTHRRNTTTVRRSVSTPDNNPARPRVGGGGAAGGTLRRIDSSRTLLERGSFSSVHSHDSPTAQQGVSRDSTSMDVDLDQREETAENGDEDSNTQARAVEDD